MKTRLHYYYLDLSNSEDKEAYELTHSMLKEFGMKCFNTYGPIGPNGEYKKHEDFIKPIKDSPEVTFDLTHIFDNQWNTETQRLMDWQEWEWPNKDIKSGYWLEITQEMKDIRNQTLACGYCGKQTFDPLPKFCPRCIGSEYLKATDLFMLRKRPVSAKGNRPPLTVEEAVELVSMYKAAQMYGVTERDKARIAKRRLNVENKYHKDIHATETEYKGMLWVMDRGININPIYYSHTDIFCFGWRSNGLDKEVAALLRIELQSFPFNWEIKEHG